MGFCNFEFGSNVMSGLLAEVGETVEDEVEDYQKLAIELEDASPLEVMDKALAKFGNDIAIAFR